MPGNLYRRGTIYWARAELRGREYRRSLRTSNRTEARKRLKVFLDEIGHAAFHGEARHTWKEAVVRFAEEFMPSSIKPSTAKRYAVSLRQVGAYVEDLYIDQIDRKTIAKIASRPGATNATRRRDLTAVSAVLRGCVAWGWIDHNPAREWDRSIIRERREPINPPTDADIDELVSRCPRVFAACIQFLRFTGMRQQEAVSLEWGQIDPTRGTVTLLKTKTSRPRTIELTPQAAGTIGGTVRRPDSRFVFYGPDGGPLKEFSSRFRQFAKGRKGEKELRFRCHDLRHKFAIEWLKEGGDIYALSRYLGHSSVKTTEIYLGYVGTKSGTDTAVFRAALTQRRGLDHA